MGELFKFFKNAVKALLLSPYYIVMFAFILLKTLLLYVYGEFMALKHAFKKFKYDKKEDYIYERRLKLCKDKNMTFDVLKELHKQQMEANAEEQ